MPGWVPATWRAISLLKASGLGRKIDRASMAWRAASERRAEKLTSMISARERADFMAGYKAAAGFAIETLNKAPRTIAEGAQAKAPQPA